MKIVNDWGHLYRMTNSKYKVYLQAGAEGKDPSASDYGKFIGAITFHAIDASSLDFEDELERISK